MGGLTHTVQALFVKTALPAAWISCLSDRLEGLTERQISELAASHLRTPDFSKAPGQSGDPDCYR